MAIKRIEQKVMPKYYFEQETDLRTVQTDLVVKQLEHMMEMRKETIEKQIVKKLKV